MDINTQQGRIMNNFNLNQIIRVKLTEHGVAELKSQAKEFANLTKCPEFQDPKINDVGDGWSEWQAWNLFSKLGHMLELGAHQPFDMNIKVSKSWSE